MEKLLTGIIPEGWTEEAKERRDFIEVTATVNVSVTDKNRERFRETLTEIKRRLNEEFGGNMIEAIISIYPRPLVRVLLRRDLRK